MMKYRIACAGARRPIFVVYRGGGIREILQGGAKIAQEAAGKVLSNQFEKLASRAVDKLSKKFRKRRLASPTIEKVLRKIK